MSQTCEKWFRLRGKKKKIVPFSTNMVLVSNKKTPKQQEKVFCTTPIAGSLFCPNAKMLLGWKQKPAMSDCLLP